MLVARDPTHVIDPLTRVVLLIFPPRGAAPQEHFVEEGTQGLHHCQLEPYEDAALEGQDLADLEDLHSKAQETCSGFLGSFKVRVFVLRYTLDPCVERRRRWTFPSCVALDRGDQRTAVKMIAVIALGRSPFLLSGKWQLP